MKRFAAVIALLALPALAAAQPVDQLCPSGVAVAEGGCIITGSGQSWIPEPACGYRALDDSQNVIVATPNGWTITVQRLCPEMPFGCSWTYSDGGCEPDPASTQGSCAPVRNNNGELSKVCTTVTLLEGESFTGYAGYAEAAGVMTVHPRAGEVVRVDLTDLAAGPQAFHAFGSWGALAVGVEDQP